MASECNAYRASLMLTFHNTDKISVAPDASRIGKPAKELLIGPVGDCGNDERFAGVGLPQVHDFYIPLRLPPFTHTCKGEPFAYWGVLECKCGRIHVPINPDD